MEKLRNQHQAFIIGVFTFCFALAGLLSSTVVGLHLPLPDQIINFVASGTASLIGYGMLSIYEWVGWRVFNPRLDFGGDWVFYETHSKVKVVDEETWEWESAGDNWGMVRIDQSVRRIRFVQGKRWRGKIPQSRPPQTEKSISDWHSMACDLSDDGDNIYLSLDHTKSPQDEGLRAGAEEVCVVDRPRNWRGRAMRMTSEVYLVSNTNKPRKVECTYERGTIDDYNNRKEKKRVRAESASPS